jgi:hypothetical protein
MVLMFLTSVKKNTTLHKKKNTQTHHYEKHTIHKHKDSVFVTYLTKSIKKSFISNEYIY